MKTTIKTPAGEKTMLLGYEAVRYLSKPLEEGQDFLDQIEHAALIGFNTYAKRAGEIEITKEEMITWFDDIEVYTEVIESVKKFAENFTQRVSGEAPTSPSKPAKK